MYQGYYPTPGLMAFLWSDAMRRATSGALWAVMQARSLCAGGVLWRLSTSATHPANQQADVPKSLRAKDAISDHRCSLLSSVQWFFSTAMPA